MSIVPDDEWHLDTSRIGRRVLVFNVLDSTNTVAAEMGQHSKDDGTVVLAREQSAGRGQYGRSWHCPAGAGVLLSVLLFPPPPLRRPALLTAWAAVSVCETIRALTGLQARIKWPNDILVRGRKVCGILIEQGRGTVAGIGMNVNQTADLFAAAGLPEAASLAVFAGRSFVADDVARALIRELDREYERLGQGDFMSLKACWKWRLGLLGKHVVAECHDGIRRGRLREMAFEGLEIEQASGEVVRLVPELVKHLEPAVPGPWGPGSDH